MKVTAAMPMAKWCPYVQERDLGTVTFTWNREAPDLHKVAANVLQYDDGAASHEEVTQALADEWGAHVTTEWLTAGMSVVVEADPA